MDNKYYLQSIIRSILANVSIGNLLFLFKEVAEEKLKLSDSKQDKEKWARKALILERLVNYLYEGGNH